MKLLWLLALLFVLVECHKPSKCAKRFHKKIGKLLRKDDCKAKLSQYYAAWEYSHQSATEKEKVVKFLEICTHYEQGTLGPLPVAPPAFEGWEFVNGYWYTVLYLDVYADVTFETIIEEYLQGVGSYDDEPEEEEVLVGTETEQKAHACHSTCKYLAKIRNVWDSDLYMSDVEATWTYLQENGGWSEGLDAQTIDDQFRMLIPISLYYTFSMQRVEKPKQSFCPEQFYAVFGGVLASKEKRCQLNQIFSDYESKCPKAPKHCKRDKMVESIGKCKRGKFTAPSKKCDDKKFIKYAAELVEAAIYDKDSSIYDLFDEELSSFMPVPTSITCDSSTSQYILLIDTIAELCGMTEWSVYIEFRAEFLLIISKTNITWEGTGNIYEFIIKFFDMCTVYLEDKTTLAPEESTTVEVESTTMLSYTRHECKSIKKFMKLFAYVLTSPSARGRCNFIFKQFLEVNSGASSSFKAITFLDGLFSAVTVEGGSSEEVDDFNGFFELTGNFIIELFFNSNIDFGKEVSKRCDEYKVKLDELFGSASKESKESTESKEQETCEKLAGPEGLFIFFDICAAQCGLLESQWYLDWKVEFIASLTLIDVTCGCLSFDLSIEWCQKLVIFLFNCVENSNKSTTESYTEETTEYSTDYTEVTTDVSDGTTTTSVVDCKCQSKFFYYVGYLFSSYEVRKKCNGHLKRFKIKNPKSSRKERSKAFIEAVGKCSKNEHSGEDDDDDQFFFEFTTDMIVDLFLNGDVEIDDYITEICTTSALPPIEDKSGSSEELLFPEICPDIPSKSGFTFFIEIIAYQCGLLKTEWFIDWYAKFTLIFFELDFTCGCWADFEIDFSTVDWCILLIEFFKKACESSIKSTTEMDIETTTAMEIESTVTPTEPNSEFGFFYFFIKFCMNAQYKTKLSKFISWYYHYYSVTISHSSSDSEKISFYKACFTYMKQCYEGTDVEIDMTGVSYDASMYSEFCTTLMYDMCITGKSFLKELCIEFMGTITLPPLEFEYTFPTTLGEESVTFVLDFMAKCGGYATDVQHIEVIVHLTNFWKSVSHDLDSVTIWSQVYMFIQIDISNACEGVYVIA